MANPEGMPDDFTMEVEPPAKIAVAYAYKKLGRFEESSEILAEVEISLDKDVQGDGDSSASNWYLKVQVAALRNDQAKVRQFMQKAIDEGWRDFWLAGLDPLMQDFRADTAIQSMLAGLQTRMSIIREQSEAEAQFASRWDD